MRHQAHHHPCPVRKLVPLLLLLALAGCGGGGGNPPNANDNPTATSGNTWTVTATTGPGGRINPAGATVNDGDTTSFTLTPDNGYTIASVTGCDGRLAGDTYTTGPVTADCTITASFTQGGPGNIWTISAAADPAASGTITGTGSFAEGETVTLTATPNSGYRFVNWTESNSEVSTTASYTFTASMDRTLVAHFAPITAADEDVPYDVAAFGYEDPRPESFHPLRRRRASLVESEELVVLPVGMSPFIEDDTVDQLSRRFLSPSLSGIPARYKSAGHADVNGDGREELILLRLGDNGLVLDVYTVGPGSDPSLQTTIVDGAQMIYARLATGDVDGDGADELIAYGVTGTDADNIAFSHVAVYDFNGTDYDRIFQWNIAGYTEMAVAADDFDGDGQDELLTVFRSDIPTEQPRIGFSANIFKRTGIGFAVINAVDLTPDLAQGGDYEVLELGAATADLDGDGLPEPVVAAIRQDTTSGTTEIAVRALKRRGENLTTMTSATQPLQATDHSPYDDELWLLATADLNGDGQEEIVSALRDFDGPNRACRFDMLALNNANAPKPYATPTATIFESSDTTTQKSRCAMAVLDNDRDAMDEVILGRLDPGDPNQRPPLRNKLWRREIDVQDISQDIDGDGNLETVYVVKSRILPVEKTQVSFITPPPLSFVGADFDGDSLEVKYTGNKWQSLPNPMVLFVASAPPNQGNISHNFADTGTTVSLIDSSSVSEGTGIGITAGVTFSVETPDIFDILSYEASVTLERAFTQSQITTQMVTRETSFSGPPDADKVIFQGTLFTSYEYEIVASPDSALIGKRMTIDEPVSTKIYAWPLDFFNASVDLSQRIGPDIIDHTPGDVASYMRESDKNALQNSPGFLQTQEVTVNPSGGSKGGGFVSTSIEVTEERVTEIASTQSVEYAAGVTVAGFGMTASQGFENTSIYSVSLSEGIRYEGMVGDILSQEEYGNYHFDWGMFIRWVERTDGAKFQVIDYWVNNLGPGYN